MPWHRRKRPEGKKEERRRQEEEERREEENGAKQRKWQQGLMRAAAPSSSGWLYPLPYRVPVTSAYGYQVHPVTGDWSFHTGVDLGAGEGHPDLRHPQREPLQRLHTATFTATMSPSTTVTAIPAYMGI